MMRKRIGLGLGFTIVVLSHLHDAVSAVRLSQQRRRSSKQASSDGKTLEFELKDATNLDTHPRHFQAATWRPHPVQDWHIVGGDAAPANPHLDFTRHEARARR